MKSLFYILAQLALVTIVYAFAYRAGYREAQSKAVAVVKKFADPVTGLLDEINESVQEVEQSEPPVTNIEGSASDQKKPSERG